MKNTKIPQLKTKTKTPYNLFYCSLCNILYMAKEEDVKNRINNLHTPLCRHTLRFIDVKSEIFSLLIHKRFPKVLLDKHKEKENALRKGDIEFLKSCNITL